MGLHHLYALQNHYGISSYQPDEIVLLRDGVSVGNLSGSTGNTQGFYVDVPSGVSNLTINISGGSGDADLYLRQGSPATKSQWDYRPYLSGNNESVSISPAAGHWYIMLDAYSSYSGVSLVASY